MVNLLILGVEVDITAALPLGQVPTWFQARIDPNARIRKSKKTNLKSRGWILRTALKDRYWFPGWILFSQQDPRVARGFNTGQVGRSLQVIQETTEERTRLHSRHQLQSERRLVLCSFRQMSLTLSGKQSQTLNARNNGDVHIVCNALSNVS